LYSEYISAQGPTFQGTTFKGAGIQTQWHACRVPYNSERGRKKYAILPNEPTVFCSDFGCNVHDMSNLRRNVTKNFGGFVLENEPTRRVVAADDSGVSSDSALGGQRGNGDKLGGEWRSCGQVTSAVGRSSHNDLEKQEDHAHRARLQRTRREAVPEKTTFCETNPPANMRNRNSLDDWPWRTGEVGGNDNRQSFLLSGLRLVCRASGSL